MISYDCMLLRSTLYCVLMKTLNWQHYVVEMYKGTPERLRKLLVSYLRWKYLYSSFNNYTVYCCYSKVSYSPILILAGTYQNPIVQVP